MGVLEILAVGITALGWLIPLLALLGGRDLHRAADQLVALHNWSGAIALVLSVLAYQLGWLVNGLAYALAKRFDDDRRRRNFFEGKLPSYDVVLATVYERVPAYARDDLAVDRSVVRMARAGALNFLLLGLVLLFYSSSVRLWAVLPLCLAGANVALYVQRLKRYYKRMADVYEGSAGLALKSSVTGSTP